VRPRKQNDIAMMVAPCGPLEALVKHSFEIAQGHHWWSNVFFFFLAIAGAQNSGKGIAELRHSVASAMLRFDKEPIGERCQHVPAKATSQNKPMTCSASR
jgi:hypothetical protein